MFLAAYGPEEGVGIYKLIKTSIFGQNSQEVRNHELVRRIAVKIVDRNLSISIGIYRIFCGIGEFSYALVFRRRLDGLLPKSTLDSVQKKTMFGKHGSDESSALYAYHEDSPETAPAKQKNFSIFDVRGSEINVYGPGPGAFSDFQLRNTSEISAIMVNRKMLTSLAGYENLSNVIAYVDGKLASRDLTKEEINTILSFMAVRQGLGRIPRRPNLGIQRTVEANKLVPVGALNRVQIAAVDLISLGATRLILRGTNLYTSWSYYDKRYDTGGSGFEGDFARTAPFVAHDPMDNLRVTRALVEANYIFPDSILDKVCKLSDEEYFETLAYLHKQHLDSLAGHSGAGPSGPSD